MTHLLPFDFFWAIHTNKSTIFFYTHLLSSNNNKIIFGEKGSVRSYLQASLNSDKFTAIAITSASNFIDTNLIRTSHRFSFLSYALCCRLTPQPSSKCISKSLPFASSPRKQWVYPYESPYYPPCYFFIFHHSHIIPI